MEDGQSALQQHQHCDLRRVKRFAHFTTDLAHKTLVVRHAIANDLRPQSLCGAFQRAIRSDDVPLDVRIRQHLAVMSGDTPALDPESTVLAIWPSPMSYSGIERQKSKSRSDTLPETNGCTFGMYCISHQVQMRSCGTPRAEQPPVRHITSLGETQLA